MQVNVISPPPPCAILELFALILLLSPLHHCAILHCELVLTIDVGKQTVLAAFETTFSASGLQPVRQLGLRTCAMETHDVVDLFLIDSSLHSLI